MATLSVQVKLLTTLLSEFYDKGVFKDNKSPQTHCLGAFIGGERGINRALLRSHSLEPPGFECPTPAAKQKSTLSGVFCFGGERGIRTLGALIMLTHFPGVRLRPTRPSLHVNSSLEHYTYYRLLFQEFCSINFPTSSIYCPLLSVMHW